MKKLILIILLITPLLLRMIYSSEEALIVQVEDNNFSKQEKDLQWEYIKDKLFEGKIDRAHGTPKKFEGPILFTINNAEKKDSLAISAIISDLQKIIPHKKIDFFSNFTKNIYSKYTNNEDFKTSEIGGYSYREIISSTLKINFETNTYKNKRGANESTKSLYFSFKKETSLADRRTYIQYEILRTICFVHNINSDELFLNITYPIEAIFNSPTYDVLDKELTEIDTFLIQKLYADDFEAQFSNYMYKTYPWRYASLFINKNLAYIKTYVLIGLIGLLIFLCAFSLFNKKNTTYFSYFFPLLVVLLSLENLHWVYRYFIDIQTPSDTIKNIIYAILHVLISSLLIAFILWFVEQKIINNYLGFVHQFILKLVLTFSVLHLYLLIGYFLSHNVNTVLSIFISTSFIFLILTLGRGLLIYLNHYSDSLMKQKELELGHLKELNAKSELKSLHAHINPHFLYNALNSITSLMYEDTSKAEDMILSLSDLFRYSINRKGKKMSTIKDEVLMVENYLKIEKIRFGERLQYTIDVNKDLLEKEIPMYLLQPLIENAVKHGISKLEGSGNISLKIKEEAHSLIITISDNGGDFPENLYSGYGLQSVYDLLRLGYGDKATLNWSNTPEKNITILIPSQLL